MAAIKASGFKGWVAAVGQVIFILLFLPELMADLESLHTRTPLPRCVLVADIYR